MSKKKVKKLNKPYYVSDDWGHTDEQLVRKINELIDIINYQQGIIKDFELALRGRQLERSDKGTLRGKRKG